MAVTSTPRIQYICVSYKYAFDRRAKETDCLSTRHGLLDIKLNDSQNSVLDQRVLCSPLASLQSLASGVLDPAASFESQTRSFVFCFFLLHGSFTEEVRGKERHRLRQRDVCQPFSSSQTSRCVRLRDWEGRGSGEGEKRGCEEENEEENGPILTNPLALSLSPEPDGFPQNTDASTCS